MRFVFGLVGLFALLATPGARGEKLNGTWKGAFDFQGSSVPLTFHLTAASSDPAGTPAGALTGTVEGLPTTPAPIHDGKIDGDGVSFWVNTDYQGATYKLVFKGQLAGGSDEIAFTMASDDGSWSSTLKAHRSDGAVPAAVAPVTTQAAAVPATTPDDPSAPATPDMNGTWKGTFNYEGTAFPLTLHLTNSGGAIAGTLEGLAPDASIKPSELHDGKLSGGVVTFWADVVYQGETYKLVYSGKVEGNVINFTFGTDDGSWSGQFTVNREQ